MRVVARRGGLRQGPQPYGVQQLRNLYNARKCDKGIPSAIVLLWLWRSVNYFSRKGWVIPVPAAAVTPEPQVVTMFIGPKALVAGLVSSR